MFGAPSSDGRQGVRIFIYGICIYKSENLIRHSIPDDAKTMEHKPTRPYQNKSATSSQRREMPA